MHSAHRRWTWVTARPRRVLAALTLVTALLAVPLITMPPDATASQEPDGAVFAARDLAAERFTTDVHQMFFTVEARDGQMLTPDALRELARNAERVRRDAALGGDLLTFTDPVSGVEVTGLWTLADRIDHHLVATTGDGLADASPDDIDVAVSALVDRVGTQILGLSVASTRDAEGGWVVPAVNEIVLADNAALGGGVSDITLGTDDTTKEQFGRDVQEVLRGTQTTYRAWGTALDVNLTSGEQGQAAGPFIGLVVVAVMLLVGVTFRSYWTVAVVGAALGALMVWVLGLANLVGLKSDQILSTIVPIALISFGVDFAIHALGRYREERAAGRVPQRALVLGLGGVMAALLLALASDAAAFLSNTVSGIESIVQFGMATSMGLAAAFALLGVGAPIAVGLIDGRVGPRRRGRSAGVVTAVGSLAAAGTAMGVVLLTVFLAPAAGVALLTGYIAVFVAVPAWLLGRRRAPAVDRGPAADATAPVNGAAVGPVARRIGATTVALAARRRIVLPLTAVVTALAAWFAVQVPAEFDVKDFFAADTDFVVSLDKLDEHVGEQGGEPATVVVEADLTDPAVLARLDAFADDVAALDTDRLARDAHGIQVQRGALDVLERQMVEPSAVELVRRETGVTLTDRDGDGRPDTPRQLRSAFDVATDAGVPAADPRDALRAGQVTQVLALADGRNGMVTQLSVGIVGSRANENVAAARAALAPEVEALATALGAVDGDASAVLTGGPIVRQASIDAVARALQLSLPISVVLCVLIGAAWMRSVRLALISVVPILLVVAWLYATMYALGFALNLVTATIGAISIGIGIDFAIHLVMRFREELAATGDRHRALRATGESTGVALVASAGSSVLGFAVLAFAPMPMFASYGLLTAIMIVMALVASLVVLPSLLLTVSRDTPRTAEAADRPAPQPVAAV
jgi:predicted RND superfamily exporter protein